MVKEKQKEVKLEDSGELKLKVESLLFAGSRNFEIDELSRLTKADPKDVKKAISELNKDYSERQTSIMLVEENNTYKFNVKDDYVLLVSNIVTETELSRTVMETLAVIAFKHPILQSELIKIRTNKAYDHLSELEQAGYIQREKTGRTKKIKLTQKFFDYFDLPPEKLKNAFENYKAVEEAIEEKEIESRRMHDDFKKSRSEAEKEAEKASKVNLYGTDDKDPFVYDSDPEVEVIEEEKPMGDLEVVDIPKGSIEEEKPKAAVSEDEPEEEELTQEEKNDVEEAARKLESDIDERADELMKKGDEDDSQLKDPVQSDDKGGSEESPLDEAYDEIEEAKDKLFKKKNVRS